MIERISFLSRLTEVDKSILFSAVAGLFGGLIQCTLEDTFDKFVNQKEININNIFPRYVYSGFICGILVGLGVFIALIFDETTSTENITQSFIASGGRKKEEGRRKMQELRLIKIIQPFARRARPNTSF